MRRSISVPLGIVAVGAAGLAYAAGVEVNLYRLRRFDVPILEPGAQPIRILHLSDIHMVPGQRRKQAWLRGLADLHPDLVVNTGDNLSHPDAVPEVLDALEPLLELPGVFVLGSNDYFQASRLNPTKYLRSGDRSHAPRRKRAENDWPALQAAFVKQGWLNLNNARATLSLPAQSHSQSQNDDHDQSKAMAKAALWASSASTTRTSGATATRSSQPPPTHRLPRRRPSRSSPSASPMPPTCVSSTR